MHSRVAAKKSSCQNGDKHATNEKTFSHASIWNLRLMNGIHSDGIHSVAMSKYVCSFVDILPYFLGRNCSSSAAGTERNSIGKLNWLLNIDEVCFRSTHSWAAKYGQAILHLNLKEFSNRDLNFIQAIYKLYRIYNGIDIQVWSSTKV